MCVCRSFGGTSVTNSDSPKPRSIDPHRDARRHNYIQGVWGAWGCMYGCVCLNAPASALGIIRALARHSPELRLDRDRPHPTPHTTTPRRLLLPNAACGGVGLVWQKMATPRSNAAADRLTSITTRLSSDRGSKRASGCPAFSSIIQQSEGASPTTTAASESASDQIGSSRGCTQEPAAWRRRFKVRQMFRPDSMTLVPPPSFNPSRRHALSVAHHAS